MDNSSRNIVNFIATITVAALLLMGAHYYAASQDMSATKAINDAPAVKLPPNMVLATEQELAEAEEEFAAEQDNELGNSDREIVIDELETINGEPSLGIESRDALPPTEG